MESLNGNLAEEEYLDNCLALIKKEAEIENSNITVRMKELIGANRDMWENSAHFSNDIDMMTVVSQHLNEVSSRVGTYRNTQKRIEKLNRMIDSPFFGRFDFIEEGSLYPEKIYIGIYNLMDSKTNDIYIYDWRAPISSIFYRYETGDALYDSPYGEIKGDVLLKRQIKVKDSKLMYYFDCSVSINDEMLQEVLGHNTSSKMRNIVETIQREQDIIIRDTENELLIVQGTAGSGKTSIALHRAAFLLYQGAGTNLESNNILVVSPNGVFTRYISSVLPELGEDNVEQTTIDGIIHMCTGNIRPAEKRNMQLETVLSTRDSFKCNMIKKSMEFKGSNTFVTIMDRLLWHFEHKLLKFEDIYYNGIIIENREMLKNVFLDNKIKAPMAKRLKRLEKRILDRIHPIQRERRNKFESIVRKSDGHEFEIKSFSRLMSIKESSILLRHIQKFTEIDCLEVYKMLFNDRKLFYRVSKGLELPCDIEEIITYTADNLSKAVMNYEDALGLLYMKLKIEGSSYFPGIKHVVIDEAQDYYPLHYEIFKLLFGDARYTVLGDVSQTFEKEGTISLYDDIIHILNKRKAVKLFLNKSYRSSYEISTFAMKFLNEGQKFIPFERHEAFPVIISKDTVEDMDRVVINDINDYLSQGFESIAVICKTGYQAEEVYSKIGNLVNGRLLYMNEGELEKGVSVTPVFMAKGLEFDAVLVYDAGRDNYSSPMDRKLLYIACTRALHRLSLYYTGDKSPFLEDYNVLS